MIEQVIRLVFSLAVVVGLLILITRVTSRRFRGTGGSMVTVLHRQHLSRTSTVTVVTVGERVLVLGATEHTISVLAELDPSELPEAAAAPTPADPEPSPSPAAPRRALPAPARGSLAGSVLSAQTWRQAYTAATTRLAAPTTSAPAGSGETG